MFLSIHHPGILMRRRGKPCMLAVKLRVCSEAKYMCFHKLPAPACNLEPSQACPVKLMAFTTLAKGLPSVSRLAHRPTCALASFACKQRNPRAASHLLAPAAQPSFGLACLARKVLTMSFVARTETFHKVASISVCVCALRSPAGKLAPLSLWQQLKPHPPQPPAAMNMRLLQVRTVGSTWLVQSVD